MTAICLWCETGFEPRAKQQRFCQSACRRAFDTACRKVGAAEIEAGRLQVSELRMALQHRARWPEYGSALRGSPPQAPLSPTVPWHRAWRPPNRRCRVMIKAWTVQRRENGDKFPQGG